MISCILPTARESYPIIGLGNVHVLQPTLYSLERQTFRNFELIIVDAVYPEKREWIEKRKWSFPIKYVPPHPNHSFWLRKKRWSVAGMLNTALLYAEGELIVRLDDCCQLFDKDYLAKFWEGYKSGYFPLAMHIRFLEGKPARLNREYLSKGYEAAWSPEALPILKDVYGEEGLIRDSRYPLVKANGGRMVAYQNQYYGYSSVSLDAALKVNGWNELCDGQKGLEDVEFGERLVNAGYRNMFLLDVNLQVVEHEHKPIDWLLSKLNHCNYGLIQYNRRHGIYRANEKPFTLEDCEEIRREICPKCDNLQRCLKEPLKGGFYIEGEDFSEWLDFAKNNTFNLREERLNV